jgi:iron complex outermembrane receptor protein
VATDNPRQHQLAQQYGFTGFAEYLDVARSLDYDEVMNNESNDSDIEHKLFTNTTTFEISESATLKNIIGYNKNESFQATDVDGSPFMVLKMGDENNTGPFGNGYQYNFEQVSNELQLSGDLMGGDLSYIVGVYYYNEEYENNIPLKFIADYDTDPFGPGFTYHSIVDDTSKSVFAQTTYAITDSLNFTVGARQTWEEVCITHQSDSAYYPILSQKEFCDKTDEPSWLVSLDYRINEANMVYLTSRASWRTGGYNNTSINVLDDGRIVPDTFKQEEAMDVEAGWKFSGTIGEIPARMNLAIYQQTIEDVQRTVYLDVTSVTGNVEEAEVKGIELDAQLDLTEWLELGVATAYTDAEYTKPKGDVIGYEFDFGPYADAPELTYSLYFQTRTEVEGVGSLTFRGDYYSMDDTYFSNLNDSIGPGTELEGYELVNFRLALDDIGGSSFSAAAYLRNATDEEYERGGLPLAGVHASNSTIAGEPRTYGVDVTYKF